MPGRVMTAGRRTQSVSIEAPSLGALNATGKPAITWSAVGSAWVSFKQLSGGESDNGGQLQSFPAYQVRMLKIDYPALTTKHRLVRGSEVYNIVAKDESDLEGAEFVLVVSRDESGNT